VRTSFSILMFLAVLLFVAMVERAEAGVGRMIGVQLLSDSERVEPGGKFRLGLLFVPCDGSHIYWRNPGDAGLAPQVRWTLPEGFVAGPLFWPVPERLEEPGGLEVNVYTDSVLLFCWVQAPAELAEGQEVKISVSADWLACRRICVQEADSAKMILTTGGRKEPGAEYALFERFSALVPRPSGQDYRLNGNASWTPSLTVPGERNGVIVLEAALEDIKLLDEAGSVFFFGNPTGNIAVEKIHLDSRNSSSKRLVLHLRMRRLEGHSWPDKWGGVLSARAVAAGIDTLKLAVSYDF
jgi:DsbC/DsbD-like thiol-disulfide interchange protein